MTWCMLDLEQKFQFHCMLLSVLSKPEGVFWRLPVDFNMGLFCIFSIYFGYQCSSNSQNHSYIFLINAKLLSLIILPEFKSSVLVIFSVNWRLQQLRSWIQGGSPEGSGRKGIFTQSDVPLQIMCSSVVRSLRNESGGASGIFGSFMTPSKTWQWPLKSA